MPAKVRKAQSNFINGELSPLAAARSDNPKLYDNGAESLRNRRPLAQGGTDTRPALYYLNTFDYAPVRLREFVFSDDQRYVDAFSNTRLDVYSTAGVVLASLTSAPWTEAMLPRLWFTQLAGTDTMFVNHPDLAMQTIKRTGASTFTRTAFDFEQNSAGFPKYQPYYKFADTAMTLTPGATSGTGVTLVLSGAGAFVAGHVGTIFRYKKKEILIATVIDVNNATGDIRETLPGTGADADWEEQAFSSVRGYPNTSGFFANRLILGGSKSLPSGFWASKIGAFFNFDLGTALDNEAIWDALGSGALSEVRGIVAEDRLLIFTADGVFLVPTSLANPLTAKNLAFTKQAPYGSAYLAPKLFDGAVLYAQKTGRVVREALWDDVRQSFSNDAVSLRAEHLIAAPTEMAALHGSTTRPEQYALFLNGDGALSVFHSVRSENVAAWVPWDTEGTIASICAAGDDVFVAVNRTLDGNDVVTLETFVDDAAPLDCSLRVVDGSPTKTFAGFDHLANETVKVVSKGHYLGEHDVDGSGNIVLDDLSPEVTEIEAGLGYTQKIRPMPFDFDLPAGPSRALVKRLIRGIAQVDRSASFRLAGNAVLLNFQGDDYDTEPGTVTGQVEFRLLGVDREAQFDILIEDPFKVTLLGLTREVQLNG